MPTLQQFNQEEEKKFNELVIPETQPCDNFISREINMAGNPDAHQCPLCEGIRYFCKNCSTDHHAGGWLKCKLKVFLASHDARRDEELRKEIKKEYEEHLIYEAKAERGKIIKKIQQYYQKMRSTPKENGPDCLGTITEILSLLLPTNNK